MKTFLKSVPSIFRILMFIVLLFNSFVPFLDAKAAMDISSPISPVTLPPDKVLYYPFDEDTTTYFSNNNYGIGYHGQINVFNDSGTEFKTTPLYYSIDFRLHASYDTKADANDAYIYPVAEGKVIYTGLSTTYGNWVVIDHSDKLGNGFVSIYAHMKETPRVKTGQDVKVNTWLGIQGNLGAGFPAPNSVTHLHFSLLNCLPFSTLEATKPAGGRCHPVRAEPMIGKHVDERFDWWPLITHKAQGIGKHNVNGNREIDPNLLNDTAAPETGWWNAGTTQPNVQESPLRPGQPIVYDVHYGDIGTGVGEIRLTANYSGWNPAPNGNWRIIARCRPDESNACTGSDWRYEWDWASDTKGNFSPSPIVIPWMSSQISKTLKDGGEQTVCISFDVFDRAGNGRYAPQNVKCYLNNTNSAALSSSSGTEQRMLYVDAGTPLQQTPDRAQFIADLTIPDDTIVSPGQVLVKTWRMKNIGTSNWSNGYQLVFVSGDKLGGIGSVSIPATSPSQSVDLSINITAPTSAGKFTGYWQLRNPQGTFFGPKIYVSINVSSPSGNIALFTFSPGSPSNTNKVSIHAKIDEKFANLRAVRLLIDGVEKYQLGAPEIYYTWDTTGYSSGDHSIVVEAADQTDTSWSRPQRRAMTYTLLGNTESVNHVPNRPNVTSPYDWYVYYSGNTGRLCAQANGDPDNDPISNYYFEIYESAQTWNSGWVGSNCVTTSALGPYDYKWRAKVRDSRGAESDWSDSWHFTLVNPNLSISELYFQPQDSNSEVVKIRSCTTGQGGIGITMKVSVNDANDGSANGQWHIIKEQGSPCFIDSDAPVWRTLEYADGPHLVRSEAHGLQTGWNGAAVREEVYTLPHRRPASTQLSAPVPQSTNIREAIYLNNRTVVFRWSPTIRASSYTLHVATTSVPSGSANPILRQNFGSGTTEYTYTFNQDYSTLYWQVTATNDAGTNYSGDQLFGIDRTSPSCSIQGLPTPTYENVVPIRWSGSDNLSSISSFDIQYMDSNRGEWSDWLLKQPASTINDSFNGQAGHSYYFRCRATDYAGNTGAYPDTAQTSTTIDPTSRPQEPWALSGYAGKRNITILNRMAGAQIPGGFPVHLQFTSATSPSAAEIYNASQSNPKCNDLRLVYKNNYEINRVVKSCTSSLIDIWLRSQESIDANGSSSEYQIYYGNPSAGAAPSDPNAVWYPYRESDTAYLFNLQEGGGSTAYDSSGNNRNCSIDGSVQWTDSLFGSGLQFNRANSGNARSLTCGSASLSRFTIEFWINANSDSDGRLTGQISPNNQLNWYLQLFEGRIRLDVWPCTTCGSSDVRSNFNLRDPQYTDRWNHVAVTFDGGNAVNFYINGQYDSTKYLNQTGLTQHNIPLEIGSVEGMAQIKAKLGGFRISSSVKNSFPYGAFAAVTVPPSVQAGTVIAPPVTGSVDLSIESLKTYQAADGGILVEALVKNNGTLSTTNGFFTDLYLNHIPSGKGDYSGSVSFWVNEAIPAGGQAILTSFLPSLAEMSLQSLEPMAETSGTIYAQVDSSGVVQEANKGNNIYLSGAGVCTANPDAYEADDSSAAAKTLNVGNNQSHNFHKPHDQDWLQFNAAAGKQYVLSTANLGTSADTYLYLYDTDGSTLLASNDDSGDSLASIVTWTAPGSGTYFILIKQWNPNLSGCSTNYDISFIEVPVNGGSTNIFLPIITNGSQTTSLFSIAGRIQTNEQVSIAGVKVSIDTARFSITDSDGKFTISSLPNGTYTITPVKEGYSFTPVSYTVTLPSDSSQKIFIGKLASASLSTSPGWTTEGAGSGNYYGLAYSVGDINGDGFDDAIVGAEKFNGAGRIYLYYGSLSGLEATPHWTHDGAQSGDAYGHVWPAGDVNHDNYDDFVVAAPAYSNGEQGEGRVEVFYGSATGPKSTPDWAFESNQAGADFGRSSGTAGDVNGDGYDDLIIGAPGYDNGETDEGSAYVFYGSTSGLSSTPNWTSEINYAGAGYGIVNTAGDVNNDGFDDVIVGARNYGEAGISGRGKVNLFLGSASGLQTTPAWTKIGSGTDAGFGVTVAPAGDVNRDGYGDILIGAYYYTNGESHEGGAFVYYGSPSGPSSSPNWSFETNQAYASVGWVEKAGDINGDGYGDITVGSPWYDSAKGKNWVFYGSASGLHAAPDWSAQSDQSGSHYGWPASAGDFNGDGFNDLLIGAHAYPNYQFVGRAFCYYAIPD